MPCRADLEKLKTAADLAKLYADDVSLALDAKVEAIQREAKVKIDAARDAVSAARTEAAAAAADYAKCAHACLVAATPE